MMAARRTKAESVLKVSRFSRAAKTRIHEDIAGGPRRARRISTLAEGGKPGFPGWEAGEPSRKFAQSLGRQARFPSMFWVDQPEPRCAGCGKALHVPSGSGPGTPAGTVVTQNHGPSTTSALPVRVSALRPRPRVASFPQPDHWTDRPTGERAQSRRLPATSPSGVRNRLVRRPRRACRPNRLVRAFWTGAPRGNDPGPRAAAQTVPPPPSDRASAPLLKRPAPRSPLPRSGSCPPGQREETAGATVRFTVAGAPPPLDGTPASPSCPQGPGQPAVARDHRKGRSLVCSTSPAAATLAFSGAMQLDAGGDGLQGRPAPTPQQVLTGNP